MSTESHLPHFPNLEYLKLRRKDELIHYHGTLRNMIQNWNNMILTTSVQGGSFVIAFITAAGYLFDKDEIISQIGSIILLIGGLLLCRNLDAQVNFFARMLRETIRVTEKVESLLIVSPKPSNVPVPTEILITHQLRKVFPGNIYVKRREKFFSYLVVREELRNY